MNMNYCNAMVVRLHAIKIDARQFLKINIFYERLFLSWNKFIENTLKKYQYMLFTV
jgi:hypothetical protein